MAIRISSPLGHKLTNILRARATAMGAVAVVVLLSIGFLIISKALAAAPTLRISTEQIATGSSPLDAATYSTVDGSNPGQDSDVTNRIVRNMDTITYRTTVSLNDSADTNVVVTLTANKNARWAAIPASCKKDASVSPVSSISADGSVLTCNLGQQNEGTNITFNSVAIARGTSTNAPLGTDVSTKAADCDTSSHCISISADVKSDAHPTTVALLPTNEAQLFVYTTSDFRIDLRTDNPSGVDNKPEYTYYAGPNGEPGAAVTYYVALNALKGSEQVAGANNRQNFTISSALTYENYAPNAAQLVTWGIAAPGACQTQNSANLAQTDLSCSQATPGAPVTIQANNVATNYLDSTQGQNIAKVRISYWISNADLQAASQADASASLLVRHTVRLTQPSPLLGVTGQQNFAGTPNAEFDVTKRADGVTSDNQIDLNATVTPNGVFDYIFTYGGISKTPGNAESKAKETTVTPGQVVPFALILSDHRPTNHESTMCTNLSTNVTFQGLRTLDPSGYNMTMNGELATKNTSPRGIYWDNVANPQIGIYDAITPAPVSPESATVWSVDYNSTTGRTLKNQGVKIMYSAQGFADVTAQRDSNCDTATDWTEDFTTLPGGAASVRRVKIVWDRDAAEIAQQPGVKYAPNRPLRSMLVASFDTKVNTTETPGTLIPAYSWVRSSATGAWFNSAPNNGMITGTNTVDPADPNYSFNAYSAARLRVVGSKISITKATTTQQVKPGGIATFEIKPETTGVTAAPQTLTITDTLPANLTYDSCVSGCGDAANTAHGAIPADFTVSADGKTLTLVIPGVVAGQPLPKIVLNTRVSNSAGAGVLENNVALTSDNDQVQQDSQPAPEVSATLNRTRSKAAVQIAAGGGLAVTKTSGYDLYEVQRPFTMTLQYRNLGGQDYTAGGKFIDIFPYNGDNANTQGGLNSSREPGSSFTDTSTGSTHVPLASLPVGVNGEIFEYTTAKSSTIAADPCAASNLPAGADPSTFPACATAYSQNGNKTPDGQTLGTGATVWTATPPADLSTVTAIRFTTTAYKTSEGARNIDLTFQPVGNKKEDLYCNSFGGRVPEISFNVISNDVCVKVISGQVTGQVWWDNNNSKTATNAESEPNIEGVRMALLDENGAPIMKPGTSEPWIVVTDSSGKYIFDNLPSGTYQVRALNPPAGAQQTFDKDGVVTPLVTTFTVNGPDHPKAGMERTDFTQANFANDPSTFGVDSITELNFSFLPIGKIGGKIWQDVTRNDTFNPEGDLSLQGITVRLLNKDGTPVLDPKTGAPRTTATDKDGNYLFANLPPGEYQVASKNPAGLEASFDKDGVQTPLVIQKISLPLNGSSMDNDFAFVKNDASIEGTIFEDKDRNTNNTTGDILQQATKVVLLNKDGTPVLDPKTGAPRTTVTDEKGHFKFEGLPPGNYIVSMVPPAGLTPIRAGDDRDLMNIDVTKLHTISVTLKESEHKTEQDFGLVKNTASISGKAWEGIQKNGLPAGDSNRDLSGLDVRLYDKTGKLLTTTKTNAAGDYLFANLPPGVFEVRISEVAGLSQTFDKDGAAELVIANITLAEGEHNPNNNFVFTKKAGLAETGVNIWIPISVVVLSIAGSVSGLVYARRQRLN